MKHAGTLTADIQAFAGRDPALDAALKALKLDPDLVRPVDPILRERLIHLSELWPISYAKQSLGARQTDLRRFLSWCRTRGCDPFASAASLNAAVEACLVDLGTRLSAASLKRLGSSLGLLLRGLGQENTFQAERNRLVLRALNRQAIERQTDKPVHRRLELAEIKEIEDVIQASKASEPKRHRDLAMIVLMCEMLLRRGELTDLRLGDWNPERGEITIRTSKTDQAGQGVIHALSPRAIDILRTWIVDLRKAASAKGLSDEKACHLPLFPPLRKNGSLHVDKDECITPMNGRSVSRLLGAYADQAGIKGVAGHTLRRSVARLMHLRGKTDEEICEAGRWETVEVMRGYVGIRPARQGAGDLFADFEPVEQAAS